MNTDQAYELLIDAGVSKEISIQMVKRWLREGKITYKGKLEKTIGYILDDTDQAFDILKNAGVAESIRFEIVRRWLREGKIKNVKGDNKKSKSNERVSKSEQDKIIYQLKLRIKAQNEHIKAMEQLHKTNVHTLIHQRDKLCKEITNLEYEKRILEKEKNKLLKDNIDLRNQLLKFKVENSKGNKKEHNKTQAKLPSITVNYRQKLGLSKTASEKEVITRFKKLLKLTHPDQGGNQLAFHYIKTDYDQYRNNHSLGKEGNFS